MSVAELFDSHKAERLLAAMLAMCRSLRLHVIAERVETEAQRAWLRRAGVSHPQRYLFGRPMPLADLLHRFPPRTG